MFSLEQLSDEVAGELARRDLLGSAPDARVSAAPDARTVRYYSTLGLLDRPWIENRQARYGERHVWQLLAIKALQSLELPLAQIQQALYARSDAELRQLIALARTGIRRIIATQRRMLGPSGLLPAPPAPPAAP
jgi:hypothetical protein